MVTDYVSLREFVKRTILQDKLQINPLNSTHSVIESTTDKFRSLGWKVERKENPTGRSILHKIASPDGAVVLSMRGGKVYRHSGSTETICKYKNYTKLMLELDNVPIPKGADFLPTQRGVALAYFRKLPKPVVVKPTNAAGSRGVTVGIRDSKTFLAAWKKAMEEGSESTSILIEQFIPGVELRAYVV